MNLVESLLSAISAALVVAGVTAIVGHYIRKSRIHRALVTDINLHLSGVREARGYLENLFEAEILEGEELSFDGRYHFGRYILYESLQGDLVRYLSKKQLAFIIEVYHRFWELESSLSGFVALLGKWTKARRVLSAEDVDKLGRLKRRHFALIDILIVRDIGRIEDLPSSYDSRVEPAELITPRTENLPPGTTMEGSGTAEGGASE